MNSTTLHITTREADAQMPPGDQRMRDGELGAEKICAECREWWPADPDYYSRKASGLGGFNSRCRACDIVRQRALRKSTTEH